MLNIAICDDNEYIRKETIRICNEYEKQNQIPMKYIEFTTGEELLADNTRIDILFLDIILPGMNGIEIMKQIEKNDKISFVIFVSGYGHYVFDTFSKKTLGFLEKPINYSKFMLCFNKALNEINKSIQIEIQINGKTILIDSRYLQYIEAQGCYSRLVTDNNNYIVRMTLKDWDSRLNEYEFIRIHKSYLVNMSYIRSINKTVILDSGKELIASRRILPDILIKYKSFCKRTAW